MTSILINIVNMRSPAWLRAQDALALLRVRPQTLYANVSRKRIRVRPDPQDPRRSLYHAADVQRLAARRRGRPARERLAVQSMAWGEPILSSGICTVAAGRLWYRGQDAVQLAERADLEQIAALLWGSRPFGELAAGQGTGGPPASPVVGSALQAAYALLARRAGRDAPMQGRAAVALHGEAATLLRELAAAVLQGIGPARTAVSGALPLHRQLARAWGRPASAEPIRRALVLLADHELNASTFATRVAASTGAALSASVLAGFATLSGPLHGTASVAVQALAATAGRLGAEAALATVLAQGQHVPGFGHPLYPEGDVRASALLGAVRVPAPYAALRRAGEGLIGEPPNVDFALSALAAAERLPVDAPFVLFALARCVGWIAHALEQREQGTLLRPRARYTGPVVPMPTSPGPALQ